MSEITQGKQRLLIVDDSKVIRVTARKILRDYFETIEAADGEQAWEILTSDETVSLVVSDLTMPHLDGFGLLELIRNSNTPQIRDLPVIIITGANDTEATMERARQAGATDFIGKPFDAVHLLARTQAHASSHAVTNTLMERNATLAEDSLTDPLTGLANEVAFMERGYQQLSYAVRHNTSLTMCKLEIDHYDEILKQHGQAFTETVINTLAEILNNNIRQEDLAARPGTARFALLLPGTDHKGACNLAGRVSRDISTRVFISGNNRTDVTISIGVAAPRIRRDTRLDELLAATDRRLARAMSQGGNLVIADDDHSTPAMATEHIVEPVPEIEAVTLSRAEPVYEMRQTEEAGFTPFREEGLEIEEIELFSPGYEQSDAGIPSDIAPVAECLSTDIPEPDTNIFAGPVPDLKVDMDMPEAMGTAADSIPVVSTKAVFSLSDETGDGANRQAAPDSLVESGESILDIIAELPPTPDPVAVDATGDPSADTTVLREDLPGISITEAPSGMERLDIDELEIPVSRPGLFRRLLARIGLLRLPT